MATNSSNDISRRELLTRAGTAAVAATTLAANVLPVHAEPTKRNKPVGANDKIVLGLIGCGGMGAQDMRTLMRKPEVEVAALCDVDAKRIPDDAAAVEETYNKKPAIYNDFRKMLERKDINGIIIGTPDHWHALNLVLACEAGMDCYCEKPISHDIYEAKAMDAAVKHFKKIVQVGTWQRSTREFTNAIQYIRSGKLGKIVTARAWKTDPFQVGKAMVTTPPANLDYDMWNGPAALMPYATNHLHSVWRWFLNYGTGMTGDWGVHMMDICLLGMSKDTDLVMPTEITTYGGKLAYPGDDRTAPDTVQSIMKFKDPDFVMHWETGRDYPGKPDHGSEFVSAEGKTLRVWRGGMKILDADGTDLGKAEAPETNDHWQNWLDCVKTREQPRSNLASMAQTTMVCHLVNASYLCGETVHFDKAKMDIVGRAGKQTQSYFREYRKAWKLPIYKA